AGKVDATIVHGGVPADVVGAGDVGGGVATAEHYRARPTDAGGCSQRAVRIELQCRARRYGEAAAAGARHQPQPAGPDLDRAGVVERPGEPSRARPGGLADRAGVVEGRADAAEDLAVILHVESGPSLVVEGPTQIEAARVGPDGSAGVLQGPLRERLI